MSDGICVDHFSSAQTVTIQDSKIVIGSNPGRNGEAIASIFQQLISLSQRLIEYGRKRAKQGAKALRNCLGKKRPIVFQGVQNGHRNWNEEKLRFIYDNQILE
jgi:hypothetical protein